MPEICRRSVVLTTLLLLAGCQFIREPVVPMHMVWYPAEGAQCEDAAGLIVMLPGMGDDEQRYAQAGMLDVLHRHEPCFDAVAVDAYFGYYRTATLVPRLHTDVIAPVASRYPRIWVVGASLGGVGALSYAREHAVERIFLLAPYLGDETLLREIDEAGGATRWQARAPLPDEDLQEQHFLALWTWLTGQGEATRNSVEVMLGYGRDDRLAEANQLLETLLPPEQIVTLDGGHKWTVWSALFEVMLNRVSTEP